MATTTAIAGGSYTSLDAAFASDSNIDPVSGVYTAIDKIGRPPLEGPEEHEQIMVKILGIPGVGTKQGGFLGRNITIDIVIVGSSKSDAESKKNALFAAMPTTSRFSVTVPGGTARPGCKLAQGSGQPKEWFNLGSRYCCLLTLEIRQMSETN